MELAWSEMTVSEMEHLSIFINANHDLQIENNLIKLFLLVTSQTLHVMMLFKRRHDIQHNATQHNDIQHNDNQQKGLVHDTQHE